MSQWGGRKVAELRDQVLSVSDICHLCGKPGADTVDHIIARKHGGGHELDNLAPAHRSCNLARGAMWLHEWFAAHPLPSRPEPSPRWAW